MSVPRHFRLCLICTLLILTAFAVAQEALRIAVLPFQNLTNNHELDAYENAIPEVLIINLSACPQITLVERARLQEILDEMQLALSGVIDESQAAEIGAMSGANTILVGSITATEDVYRINARLVNVGSSEILLTGVQDWLSDDEIIAGVDELSQQIIFKLTGEQLDLSPEFQYEPLTIYDDRVLSMETALDQPIWLNGSGAPVTLQVDIYSKEVPQRKRIPLNLALVIDRSGSMASERKLDYVKNAARFIVQNMSADDNVALVCYASQVQVVAPAQTVKQKRKLIELIDEITPGGSTNLSGGMLEGFSQVAQNRKVGRVNRVLLLSDGLANEGITRTDKLQEICYEKSLQNMSISTFGVGADFDEDLLMGLAKLSVGNYYFIHSPEQIPTIFAGEMSGLLAVAAQNVKVHLKTLPGVKVRKVYGYLSAIGEDQTEVPVGDIFSNEHYALTFELELPETITDSLLLAEVILQYDDVVNAGDRIETKSTVYIQSTTKPEERDYYRNPYVQERLTLLNSSLQLQAVVQQANLHNLEETQQSLAKQAVAVADAAREFQSVDLKKQVLAIHKYSQEFADVAEYRDMQDKYGIVTQPPGASASKLRMMQKSAKYDSYQLQKQNKSKSDVYSLPQKQTEDEDTETAPLPKSTSPQTAPITPEPDHTPSYYLPMQQKETPAPQQQSSPPARKEVKPQPEPVKEKKTSSSQATDVKPISRPSKTPQKAPKEVPQKTPRKKAKKAEPKSAPKKADTKPVDTETDETPKKPDLKR